MKLSVGKNKIFTFLFFTLFLDAYSLLELGNRDVTPIYIGFFFLIGLSVLRTKDIVNGIRQNSYALLMLLYMPMNYLIKGKDGLSSLLIGMFCWFIYVISYRKCKQNTFDKTVHFFQLGMNVMAVYGIYQVLAYKLSLPLGNPWIEGLMVTGYNWGNDIDIAGITLRRANAVFREPSYFSQFLAMNILIYFSCILANTLNSKSRRHALNWILINGVALILSFSGTGLLMLFMGLFAILFINKKQDTLKFIKKYLFIILIVIIIGLLLLIIPNPLKEYLIGRTSEFDATNAKSISGYIRMVLPYEASLEIISNDSFLFGCGIGNSSNYLTSGMKSISFLMSSEIGRALASAMQPIIPRTIAEEGMIGFSLLILFYLRVWKAKCQNKSNIYKALLVGTLIMSFMHGTWSSEVYWLFLAFLNVELQENMMQPKLNKM